MSWPNLRYSLTIFLEEQRKIKTTHAHTRDSRVPGEIGKWHLLNTKFKSITLQATLLGQDRKAKAPTL